MQTKVKLAMIELISGICGWVWIILSLATIYFLVMALFFEGEWQSFFWAFGVGGISKWLARAFEETKQRIAYEAHLVSEGYTPELAREKWYMEYTTTSKGPQIVKRTRIMEELSDNYILFWATFYIILAVIFSVLSIAQTMWFFAPKYELLEGYVLFKSMDSLIMLFIFNCFTGFLVPPLIISARDFLKKVVRNKKYQKKLLAYYKSSQKEEKLQEKLLTHFFNVINILYKRGYQGLQLYSFKDATGMTTVFLLTNKQNLDHSSHYHQKDKNKAIMIVYRGHRFVEINDQYDYEDSEGNVDDSLLFSFDMNISPSDLADKIESKYSEVLSGTCMIDDEYNQWFSELYEFVKQGYWPIFSWDSGYGEHVYKDKVTLWGKNNIMVMREPFKDYFTPEVVEEITVKDKVEGLMQNFEIDNYIKKYN